MKPKQPKTSGGQPETAEELINKYGTYEIQPTADTDNPFPAIAQGRYTDGQLRKLRRQCRVEAEAQKDRKN